MNSFCIESYNKLITCLNPNGAIEASSRWCADWRATGVNKVWLATELDQAALYKVSLALKLSSPDAVGMTVSNTKDNLYNPRSSLGGSRMVSTAFCACERAAG